MKGDVLRPKIQAQIDDRAAGQTPRYPVSRDDLKFLGGSEPTPQFFLKLGEKLHLIMLIIIR